MKFIEYSAKLSPIKKWGLLEIEWAILGGQSGENAGGHGLLRAWSGAEIRHHERCRNQARDSVVCRTGIRSRAFGLARAFVAYSVIQMCGSSRSIGAQKTICSCCGRVQMGWYDCRLRRVRDLSSAGFRIVLELEVRRIECGACASVKRERLEFLADNPHFTKRFAFYVGRRCRQAAIRDVAKELKLDRIIRLELAD